MRRYLREQWDDYRFRVLIGVEIFGLGIVALIGWLT